MLGNIHMYFFPKVQLFGICIWILQIQFAERWWRKKCRPYSFKDAVLLIHYVVSVFLYLISVPFPLSYFLFIHSFIRKRPPPHSFNNVHLSFLPAAAGTCNCCILKIRGKRISLTTTRSARILAAPPVWCFFPILSETKP